MNPQLGAEGEELVDYLQKKYGMSAAQWPPTRKRSASAARNSASPSTWNAAAAPTTPSTRTGCCTGRARQGGQRELKHALLRAYFTDGRDVSDHDTLVDVAGSVGLPADRAREILGSDTYAEEVRTVEQFFLQQGIQAVPAVIIDRKHLISGGQPVEVFEQALRQIAAANPG